MQQTWLEASGNGGTDTFPEYICRQGGCTETSFLDRVAEAYEAQLLLFAELCFQRNYLSIAAIEAGGRSTAAGGIKKSLEDMVFTIVLDRFGGYGEGNGSPPVTA